MSAPWFWIILPMVFAGILWLLRNNSKITGIVSMVLQAILAGLAALMPIGISTRIGPIPVEIASTLSILGRRLVLENADRSYLAFLFAVGALWALITMIIKPHRSVVPLQMVIISLLVAARAVEPFLFGAVLVEIAVLVSIPMLVPPGTRPGRGVLRYLIFQTLALPVILLAGWAFNIVQIYPENQAALARASIFLGLGFAFWLGVFPFYTWIPMLSEESHPVVNGFILSFLPFIFLMLGLDFLNGFVWLRQGTYLVSVLQVTGVLMIVTGGIWAAFQQTLVRMAAYALILDTGFLLLALSLQNQVGMETFAANWIPRQLSLILLAYGFSTLQQHGYSLSVAGVKGSGVKYPILTAAIALAFLSFTGLPLTGTFAIREPILGELSRQSIVMTVWALVGVVGLLVGLLRVLFAFFAFSGRDWRSGENWYEGLIFIAGMVLLLGAGLFPAEFFKGILNMLESFPNLP